jgi:anaerobic magnesium-protoporphyrin IX monomethyl ester cyclase
MRVLLLNPPGDRLYIRDLYCSITSKARYYWQPADLAVLSGALSERHDVCVLDAMIEGLSADEALERALAAEPDAVVSLTGSASWPADFAFFSALKRARPGLRVAITGDLVIGQARRVLAEHDGVDACLLDFTSPSVLRWLEGAQETLPALAFRRADGALVGPGPDDARGPVLRLPAPRHDLFPLSLYHLPYARGPVATVLTSFACPYTCSFCIQSSKVMTYRYRPAEDVLAELRALRALGVREFLFRDPLFESNRKNALELCARMREEGLGLTWSCNSRADTLDETLVTAMSAAGCRTILIGFESASDATLAALDKKTTLAQAARAVALCRGHGIGVCGYFILGMPPETREDALRTIQQAIDWGLDYASFAAPSPDYGTPLREQALARGWTEEGLTVFNRSESSSFDGRLRPSEIEELLRLAHRRFYLRPAWLLGQLGRVGSLAQLWRLSRDGVALLRRVAA